MTGLGRRLIFWPTLAGLLLILTGLFLLWLDWPSRSFPVRQPIAVAAGSTASEVAHNLKELNLIRSTYWLTWLVKLRGEGLVQAGEYYFEEPALTSTIARRLTSGNFGLPVIKVTIPEGLTVREVGQLLARKLPAFSAVEFIGLASEDEGYLFPDTYFFPETATPAKVRQLMLEHFDQQVASLLPLLLPRGLTLNQAVIMASLLEEEAKDPEVRRLISGILWKRHRAGMALQVDAVFPYIIGKNTFEVSRADLATDSPYNTYRYPGLPIGPISNPGLDSLAAAISPVESDYWYYLSDYSGHTYYAVDYEEHKKNKNRYLP